ncbi:MAG: MFS transporter [Candidatus Moraniibacteriota bacterium]
MHYCNPQHLHIRKPHYFDGKVSQGFISLFYGKAITNIAVGLFNVFLPIFLYETFGGDIKNVAFYYLAGFVLQFLFVFFLSHSLNKFGFRRALRTSTLIGALFYTAVFLLNKENVWIITPIMVFLIAFWRFLYWIPYNIDFAKFTSKKDRGKELGLTEAVLSFISIITPVVAGFVVVRFGFNALFFFGILIFSSSLIPYIFLPRTKEKFSWSKYKIIKKIFSGENRKAAILFFLDGMESVLPIFVWPIFLFELLNGDYLKVGLLSTFVIAFTVILQLFTGKMVDKKRDKIFKTGSAFYAFGWFLKIFVTTAFHVFIIDSYHKFMKIFYRIPLDTFIFEKASQQNHLIDEFNVFRQVCLVAGRITTTLAVITLSFFVSLNWIFVLEGISSIFIGFIYTKFYCALR